jgi:hypothetical protein
MDMLAPIASVWLEVPQPSAVPEDGPLPRRAGTTPKPLSARWIEPLCWGAAAPPRGNKKFWKTYPATDWPSVWPAVRSKLQWKPAQIRLMVASSAAAEKPANVRVTPGRPSQEILNGIVSVPK